MITLSEMIKEHSEYRNQVKQFLQSEPVSEISKDKDGNPIKRQDGNDLLYIPKENLDEDLDGFFGHLNYGTESAQFTQAGNILICNVKCWYESGGGIRYTAGSASEHISSTLNKSGNVSEIVQMMAPALQSRAEKNAWAKLGKRLGRGLNNQEDAPTQTAEPPPANAEDKFFKSKENTIFKMIENCKNTSDLIKLKSQNLDSFSLATSEAWKAAYKQILTSTDYKESNDITPEKPVL
jgi:hypothetical protein